MKIMREETVEEKREMNETIEIFVQNYEGILGDEVADEFYIDLIKFKEFIEERMQRRFFED